MSSTNVYGILKKYINNKEVVNISVDGISMNPTLKKGDILCVKKQLRYNIGEIVVFNFKNEGVLVHRILKTRDSDYFCKGDNAFRLEQVNENDIIGKVILVNDMVVPIWPQWKIKLSYNVNRIFYNSNFNIALTKSSNSYKLYKTLVLNDQIQDFYCKVVKQNLKLKDDEKFYARFSNNYCIREMYFEIFEMISKNISYKNIIILIAAKYNVKTSEAQKVVNIILTNLVINKILIVEI
ncbi:MAG: S24/S26 family peptidase [Bacilli bacterium]|nr:S24/S26 family peptidase [Bacilli bacterium]